MYESVGALNVQESTVGMGQEGKSMHSLQAKKCSTNPELARLQVV